MELLLYVKIPPLHQQTNLIVLQKLTDLVHRTHEGMYHLLMKVKISYKIQNPHHRMNTLCPIIICLILAIKVILLKPEK